MNGISSFVNCWSPYSQSASLGRLGRLGRLTFCKPKAEPIELIEFEPIEPIEPIVALSRSVDWVAQPTRLMASPAFWGLAPD